MSLPYHYQSNGRRRATTITVAIVWAMLALAFLLLDAAPLVLLFIFLFTLPALYDLVADPVSTLFLDDTHLRWKTPRQRADIPVTEIDHLRFDTRLDMSVRLTIVRPSGVKIRIPFAATPPHLTFESAARQAGIKTERHHFSLMG
ncbi:hypothetical protein OS189_08085 [Sulfitobacter sp. F26169L]|uniref:hypothetical protein n=1 Tax=Sulfitobacter sp. F26169L TaxID=2996015 RepID=UPI002260DC40|nr:hypothetical protein [Sulfitobacter sp. F26169L]MCX7566300.1 hypothetical protein [Sulfitobacter sp. F26169L]